MDYIKELDLLKTYLHLKISCDFAVDTRSHRSSKFPSLRLTTTLWKEQIPSFNEFKYFVAEKGWSEVKGSFYDIPY